MSSMAKNGGGAKVYRSAASSPHAESLEIGSTRITTLMVRLGRRGSGNWAMETDGTDGMAREVRVWMRTIDR